ncbi:MAG: tetratricopeptide repeat protein, partial [Anaerolineae bacterium]
LIVAIIVSVVAFDFTSNQARATSIPTIIANSFAKIGLLTAEPRGSWGMVMLLALTIPAGAAVTLHRAYDAEDTPPDAGWILKAALVFLAAVLLIPLAVAWAKADLLRVGKDVSGIIARWYVIFFALVFALGAALFRPGPSPRRWAWAEVSWAYAILAVVAGLVIWNANGVLVKADVWYQQGYLLEQDYMKNAGSLNTEQRLQVLDRVLGMYKNAIRYAPSEDFYYLAMARVYQQMVPLAQTPQKKQVLLNEGIATVEKARSLYPLNVDHTANMGRFYRTWAQEVSDPAERQEKLQLASDYYAQATQLSPNKAHLYNEWALTYYLMGDYEKAREKLEKSLSLDALYDQTYLLLGQLYTQQGDWANAEEMYRKAVDLNPTAVESLSMLGYVLDQQGKVTEAITQNLRVLELAPQDYITIRNLSVLYNKLGDYKQALSYAQQALGLAPDSDKAQLEQFVAQLQALAGGQ